MRIAAVYLSHFISAVEASRNSALAGRPLIVGDAEQPKRVLDCSAEATAQHVRHHMTIRAALSACPDAVVIPPDPVLYRSLWERSLEALSAVSPEVEDDDWGCAYLNVAGLQGHYANDDAIATEIIEQVQAACGLRASVGIAGSKFPAYAASATVPQGQINVIRRGKEPEFLASQSIDILPVDLEIIVRLRLLGLQQIGDMATLTVPELQSQFGFEGKRLWQLANGIDSQPLRPRPAVEVLADDLRFEAPVAGIDIMVAGAKQLLSRLQPLLRGRAARELTLQAELTSGRGWERRLVFREAVSESERLGFVLRSTLQNAPPPMAVHSLTLRLAGLTGETGKQMALGERGRLQRQLEECIRQLKARYGYSPIYRCVDVESWSVVPEDRQLLVETDG